MGIAYFTPALGYQCPLAVQAVMIPLVVVVGMAERRHAELWS